METSQGPISQLISAALSAAAEHMPRDLTWPILTLTLSIATLIWLLRGGLGAKGADGRMRQMGFIEFLAPWEIYV
ncbi:MAG: fatty acid hydroxylase family protein, partial [Gammaproteobacteria bacterium]|nr:fatty acid hydroxylase family protein [Gammaproteobacteria bacterium]